MLFYGSAWPPPSIAAMHGGSRRGPCPSRRRARPRLAGAFPCGQSSAPVPGCGASLRSRVTAALWLRFAACSPVCRLPRRAEAALRGGFATAVRGPPRGCYLRGPLRGCCLCGPPRGCYLCGPLRGCRLRGPPRGCRLRGPLRGCRLYGHPCGLLFGAAVRSRS